MTSFVVYVTFRFLFWLYLTLFHNLKVFGRKNVPRRGAFLIASNHASYLDPILIGVSTQRFLKYLARDTLFNGAFLGWAMRNVRAMPKFSNRLTFHPLRVYFGSPVYFGNLFNDRTKFGYDKVSQEIMRCSGELKARYESEVGG